MDKFTFTHGNWRDGNPLPEWSSYEGDLEYLKENGFPHLPDMTYGDEDGASIRIYSRQGGTDFLADVCPFGGNCFEVYLPDFPSMMMFVKDYGSAFTSVATSEYQQQTFDLLAKFFQSTHGHPAYDICPECDPVGWQSRVERRSRNQ